MERRELICMWIAQLLPLGATVFSFLYGLRHFFKRGKQLFLQSITMAMGCHALGTVYHLCLMLTNGGGFEGFTPAYLGRIGFFLFLIAASYGQMDRIIDDGSKAVRSSRYLALIAPACAALLYLPVARAEALPGAVRVSVLLVWIPAMVSVYFNLKHAIIPNCDFGFVEAIKPYNMIAVGLGFAELACLCAENCFGDVAAAVASVVFSVLCAGLMFAAKKGAEEWIL